MNTTVAKLIATAAIATFTGLTLTTRGAQADDITVSTAANQPPTALQLTTTSLNLYSNNLAQVKATQAINFPAGYTLDAVRNVNSQAAANAFEQPAPIR